MTTNDFDAHNDRPGRRERQPERDAQPLEREVPLGMSRTPAAIHEWLDGDVAESTVSRGDMARHVDFWNRFGSEVAERRQMRTPAHVTARIMDALPQAAPHLTSPWWRQQMAVTPVTLAAAAASLLALGLAIGATVR